MTVLAFQTIRQRVAAQISALSGWTQSSWHLDTFGRDPDQVQHHAFAVGILSSSPTQQPGRRQIAEGLATASQVQVQFAHRLTVDGQVSAYDAALSAELDLISAVLTLIDRHALHILWDGSTRSSLGEGWIIVTVNFSAIHRI